MLLNLSSCFFIRINREALKVRLLYFFLDFYISLIKKTQKDTRYDMTVWVQRAG